MEIIWNHNFYLSGSFPSLRETRICTWVLKGLCMCTGGWHRYSAYWKLRFWWGWRGEGNIIDEGWLDPDPLGLGGFWWEQGIDHALLAHCVSEAIYSSGVTREISRAWLLGFKSWSQYFKLLQFLICKEVERGKEFQSGSQQETDGVV